MKYQGLRQDGTWEEFETDRAEDATPEATGYMQVYEWIN